ncbi:hypothetical protein PLEOSDRAFT_1045039 [Pleurotus ostreatus PC15]|uniref:Dynactin subunit 4 n=1 Tax=Pleurotus ostreatus (strain PC15) TaxID=1137138 RepID=A0A067NP95_PLEO1|nr:hypothetical protein PLEOSDRAFT_1045039 [Pleurotus ostreatus PC15]
MAPSIHYHCPCLSQTAVPPPPHLPSSSHSFHPLHTLFFCEECDAVRCNRCVSVEVSGYYCPNCLFEVPSASVRAEKNRCARNCFQCPNCMNTLSVVPSDPPEMYGNVSGAGEAPFFLYCNHCRWDSAEVGITFEKPTGLAAQLHKTEESAPEALEFDRLREHFEPFIRASSLAASTSGYPPHIHAHTHQSTAMAGASAALSRDVPGMGRYNNAHGRTPGRPGRDRTANKDEFPVYKSRMDVVSAASLGGGGERDVELMQHLESPYEVAGIEQRWELSWMSSFKVDDLKPLRVPLHAKRTKRCPACTHILIKPEQKAQSVRFKIKLMAANYLPAIVITLPHVQNARPTPQDAKRTLGRSTAAPQAEDEKSLESQGGMNAGKTYPFHLAFTNPLYDPIQVKLSVQRVQSSSATPVTAITSASAAETASKDSPSVPEKARRPPFAISLPTSFFAVAAFAEAWEYDDDEDMFDDESLGLGGTGYGALGRAAREKEAKTKTKNVGVLEKRANVTVVGGEVVIGKEAKGNVKFNMLVTYTYRSDEGGALDDPTTDSPVKSGSSKQASSLQQPDVKTFAFYTVVDLGPIIPREEPKVVDFEL